MRQWTHQHNVPTRRHKVVMQSLFMLCEGSKSNPGDLLHVRAANLILETLYYVRAANLILETFYYVRAANLILETFYYVMAANLILDILS